MRYTFPEDPKAYNCEFCKIYAESEYAYCLKCGMDFDSILELIIEE